MMNITRSRRRWLLAALAGCTSVVVGASFSWACTAEAGIQLFPKSGPVGTEVTVIGEAFAYSEVEIRLDTPTGELLGRATGPQFETMVVLPEMDAGEHTIIGITVEGDKNRPQESAGFAPQQFLTTPGTAPVDEEPDKGGNGKRPNQQGNPGSKPSQPSNTGRDRDEVVLAGSDSLDRTAVDSGRTVFAGSVAIKEQGPAAVSKAPLGPTASGLFGDTVADAAPSLSLGAQQFGDDPLRAPFAIGIALMAFGSLALLAGAFMFLLLGKREARAADEESSQL